MDKKIENKRLVKFIHDNKEQILMENGVVTEKGLRESFENSCKRYGVPYDRAALLYEELKLKGLFIGFE